MHGYEITKDHSIVGKRVSGQMFRGEMLGSYFEREMVDGVDGLGTKFISCYCYSRKRWYENDCIGTPSNVSSHLDLSFSHKS